MNKRERVRAAVAGTEVDCVPCGFWLHFPAQQAFGVEAIRAHLDFYRDTDVDVLKVMNEALYRNEAPVTSLEQWANWKPLRAHGPHFQRQLDIVKAIADAVGGEVPVLATIHGAFISTFHGSKRPEDTIKGSNAVTEHLRRTPEAVVPALEAVSESLIELSLACLDAGADGIYYGAQGGEAYRFQESIFLEYVKPYDVMILREVRRRTDLLVLHICKDEVRLPLYADYPADVVNWAVYDSDYSLIDGRSLFRRTILGGLDDRAGVMIDGSESDIRREVAGIICGFGKGGFILGADCTLPTDIARRRIRLAVEAARSF
jgi:uroporphyrinogen decarboxylase